MDNLYQRLAWTVAALVAILASLGLFVWSAWLAVETWPNPAWMILLYSTGAQSLFAYTDRRRKALEPPAE